MSQEQHKIRQSTLWCSKLRGGTQLFQTCSVKRNKWTYSLEQCELTDLELHLANQCAKPKLRNTKCGVVTWLHTYWFGKHTLVQNNPGKPVPVPYFTLQATEFRLSVLILQFHPQHTPPPPPPKQRFIKIGMTQSHIDLNVWGYFQPTLSHI